jgi:ATP/ADP translocase
MILYDVRKYAMESVYVCLLSIMILLWIFHPLQLRKSYEKNEKQKKQNTYHNFITVPKFNGKRAETGSQCMP